MNNVFHYVALANGWTVGRFRALEELGVAHAVTTSKGLDVQLVRHDHQAAAGLLADALGFDEVAFVNQVHGGRVLPISRGGIAGDADGLVTARAGVGVMTRGADCTLILAYDPRTQICASAHASWRGTVAKIAREMISQMSVAGASAASTTACICPSAGGCCYQVKQDVVDQFALSLGSQSREFFQERDGLLYLDLWSANRRQLLDAGVAASNIHVAGVCTICSGGLFPSHRRDGEAAGRLAAVVGLTS